jgi:hypothetical protein
MRERSWNNVVRRAGALALVWVLVAVASWAIASGGGGKKNGHSQPQPVVTGSQASLQLPALNAKLPAMRVKHRRTAHAAHAAKHRSQSNGAVRTAQVDTPASGTTTSSESPASTGTSSAGSSSSGAASSSSGNVPPTGGAPAP